MVRIYGLFDPQSMECRYIGKTNGGLSTRLRAHISDVKRGRTYIPRHRWIADLLLSGREPIIQQIDSVSPDRWEAAEQFWIAHYRNQGCKLLNATAGGDGLHSYKHSELTRRKQSAAAVRRYASVEERRKTGNSVRLAFRNPETRMKLCGRQLSEETRRKMSEARRHYLSGHPEINVATSARFKGRTYSEEVRRRMSLAKKGKPRSPESIAKQVASMAGYRHTAETKAKISKSNLAVNHSEIGRGLWAIPEYRAKQMAWRQARRAMMGGE